jgi:RNA polymerase-binding transcription factor DksA
MADICDDAAKATAEYETDRIAAARKASSASGPAATHCDECGDEMDPERIRHMPGARLCVSCATDRENGRPYHPR